MRNVIHTAVILTILLIVGCNTKPSDKIARSAFSSYIEKESGGNIVLTEFSKTNGSAMEVMGQKTYEYRFWCTVRFMGGAYKDENAFMGGPFTNFYCSKVNDGGMPNPRKFYHGAKVDIEGKLTFVKMENGWELREYKMENAVIKENPNPLIGTWKISNRKSSGCVIDSIQINERNFLIFSVLQETQTYKFNNGETITGVYDFYPGDGPENSERFRGQLNEYGTQLVLSTTHSNVIFVH